MMPWKQEVLKMQDFYEGDCGLQKNHISSIESIGNLDKQVHEISQPHEGLIYIRDDMDEKLVMTAL